VPLPRVVLWPSRASIFRTWRSRPRDSARVIVVEVGGPRRRHRRGRAGRSRCAAGQSRLDVRAPRCHDRPGKRTGRFGRL